MTLCGLESVDMSHDTMCGEFPAERKIISDKECDVNVLVAKPPKFRVGFKQCSVTMTADSGASCSIIDGNTFRNSRVPTLRNVAQIS